MNCKLILFALTVSAIVPSFGQGTTGFTVVRGKDRPELINDATAYLHLFRALEQTQSESDLVFSRRRQALAKETGLGGPQIPLLLATADSFAQQGQALNWRMAPGLERQAARAKMTLQLVNQLQQALGPHDAYLLTEYVNGVVKPQVTLYLPR
jgi:hypothetical protein